MLPAIDVSIPVTGLPFDLRYLSPVTDDYAAPFAYPGKIERVVFELPGAAPTRGEVKAHVRSENARQ